MSINIVSTKPERDFTKVLTYIYGEPKIGKTTLASKYPGALFMACEPGHKFVTIDKVDCFTWEDVRATAAYMCKEKHDYKTVVVDTVDEAFKMCERYIYKKKEIEHASDLGFGKGYAFVRDEFHSVFSNLAKFGFGIVFISHSRESEITIKGLKKTRFQPTLGATASKVIRPMCDFIFYVYSDEEGRRKVRTKGTENVEAGDRTGRLPEVLNLDFNEIKEAFEKRGE